MTLACRAFLAVVFAASPAAPQQVTLGGQLRPRFEFREPVDGGEDAFVSMRARAHLVAALEKGVRVFLQLQDVRLFGEETSTLGDFRADNFDLHQGWVELTRPGTVDLTARLGRQEIVFGGERLVGAVNWAQQGRAFDGARITAAGSDARVDVFGALLSDATARSGEEDAYVVGAYGRLERIGPGTLDLYGIFDRVEGPDGTSQGTLGGRWWGERNRVRFRGEASVQVGERAGSDVVAFLVGARVGLALAEGRGSVTLWYDYLSGDDDPADATVRVFDTLFATNHKFYGFADLFTNIPAHTAGRGLQDLAVKGSYRPAPALTLALDIHSFRVARSAGLGTGHLGEEADLTLAYRYSQEVRLVTGISHILAGRGFAEIGRLEEDSTWLYVMTDVSF
ncbi:MAG: alginate export family protein [Gemmatimonadota bacterium]